MLPIINYFTLMKSPSSHWESLTLSYTLTELPDDWTDALKTSGNWVDEWLPQIITFLTLLTHVPRRLAIADWALQNVYLIYIGLNIKTNKQLYLLWSSLVIAVKFSFGMEGA